MSGAKVAIVTAATNTIMRFRIDMLDEFVRHGAEVMVLGDEPESVWEGVFADHHARYRSYPVARNGVNPLSDLTTLRALESLFREERPTHIFTYQAKPNIYGTLAAARVGGIRCFAMMGGLGSVFHGKDLKSKLVGTIVACEYRAALKHAEKVFFQNHEDVATFKKRGIIRQDQVVMVHGSGVNLEKFPQEPLPSKPSFLFVGRLVRGKGVLDYLEAARMVKKQHPEASFVLVGPYDSNPTALGPKDIEPYIQDGTVRYEGERQPDEIHEFMKACSCFVLPSYYGEGTPKSALEAMATGRPLIVANAVGCREVVREGENGFLVPPKDPQAIAEAMGKLIKNADMKERMAAASRSMAESMFDVRKVNATICEAMEL